MSMIFILILILIYTSAWLANKHVVIIHSSVPMLVIAMIISYYINTYHHKSIISNAISNTFIYQFLLPLIVLAEGFNNRKKSMDIYKKDILSLGVVIPLINCFIFGGLLIGTQALGLKYLGLSPDYKQQDMILFAMALVLSLVDVHGAIAPLHKFHNSRLEKIFFGASTVSNNVSLLLVLTFERMLNSSDFSEGSAITNFMKAAVLSPVFGALVGGLATWVLKNQPYLSANSLLETLYVMIGAYMTYALVHLPFFQLSGDVSLFFYGMMMSHYNRHNMNIETFKNIGLSLTMIMMMAEMICFIYIGMSIEDAFVDHLQNIGIALVVIFLLIISRAICISILVLLDSKNKHHRIKGKEWIAVLSSGIIKSPISYILATMIVASKVPCLDRTNPEVYKKVVPLFIVQLTTVITLFFGCPMNYFVMSQTVKEEHSEGSDVERKTLVQEGLKKLFLENKWELDVSKPKAMVYIDEFVLKPLLIRDYHQRKKQIYEMKAKFDREAELYMNGGDGHGDHGDHGDHADHADHGKPDNHGSKSAHHQKNNNTDPEPRGTTTTISHTQHELENSSAGIELGPAGSTKSAHSTPHGN